MPEKTKKWWAALAVLLIDCSYERVGNPTSAEDGHYGITGWKVKHLTFGKGGATIKYVGKSGVSHEKHIKDPFCVRALKEAVKGKKPEDEIVDCDASAVNEYLKPFDITAKDIRGLHANREMKERLKAIRSKGGKLPTDKKEREKKLKAEFKEALEGTAEAVGHEPATLKSQYLVPGLEDDFMKDGTVNEKMNKKAIINIDNATDGMVSREYRGVSGLLSSLTYYETALMQDLLVHPTEYIQVVLDDDSDASWYVLRNHVLNPSAVGELVAAGYLQERNDGTIRVSDIFEAKKSLYQYDLNIPGMTIPDEMKIAVIRRIATKSHAEKEDEAIRDLSRKTPSKKPPRHDLRDEQVDPEKKPDEFGAEGDRDLSLNYKRVASRWVLRVAKRGRSRLDKKKDKQQSAEHEPGDTWQTEKGWAGKNPDGVSHSFKGDTAQDQAEAYAKGMTPEPEAEKPGVKEQKAPEQEPKTEPEVQPKPKLETPEDWAARIPSPESFNKIMKGLAHFEEQMSGVDDSYEIPDIPDAPTGLTTMGQVRELLSRKKELSKLVGKSKGKGKNKDKGMSKSQIVPADAVGDEDFETDDEGNVVVPVGKQPEKGQLVSGAEQILTTVGATEDFMDSMKLLPPDQQQEILDSFHRATQDVQISLEMLDESVDQDFIKEASQAYKSIRGGREVGRVKGYDPGYDDEDEELGEIISFNKQTGDIELAASPEEIGRYLALAKIAPQLADPGRGVDDEPKSDKELDDLAKKSFDRFKNLSPDLRAEAAVQMKDQLEGLPQDNPRREQLERTLDGLALAASIRGERLVVDKQNLRPDMAPGFRVLAKILDRKGKIDVLLGSMEHYSSPESRQIVGEALDNLTGPEISEILGGDSGPWKKLLKDVDWEDHGDAGQEEIKKMLRRVALDEMTTLQALMETVAEDQTGDSPLSVEKLYEHMEKWRNNKKLPKKVLQAVDAFTNSCQSGDESGKADCLDTKNRVEVSLLASWLEELKRAGANLKPDNPLVAQIQDVMKTGDVSKLDMKYVPAGAQDVTVGG